MSTFKKITFSITSVLFIVMITAPVCNAYTLLTKEQALREIFGADCEFVTEKVRLRGPMLEKVMERLGGKLVYEQIGSESETVAAHNSIDFYYAVKNGEKIGVAIVDVQPGKWGPVDFLIAMDLQPKVKQVAVLRYMEKRGRPIARSSFMKQYEGKTTRDSLEVGKDITGISGATISSRAATFSVKKALVLVEECL